MRIMFAPLVFEINRSYINGTGPLNDYEYRSTKHNFYDFVNSLKPSDAYMRQ